jgi:hypothetical protein
VAGVGAVLVRRTLLSAPAAAATVLVALPYLAVMFLSTQHSPSRVLAMMGLFGALILARAFPQARQPLRNTLVAVAAFAFLDAVISLTFRSFLFGNPNIIGSMLIFSAWPLLGMAATQSRAVMWGGLAALAVLHPRVRGWLSTPRRRWAVVAVLAVALIGLMSLRLHSVEHRLQTWASAVLVFVDAPGGIGVGGYPALLQYDHADNGLLTAAVEMGWAGALAWLVMVGGWAWLAYRRGMRGWPVLTWCISQVFDDTLGWPLVSLVLGAEMGWMSVDEERPA